MKGILNLGSIGNREHIAEVFVWATFLCFNLTSPFKGGNKTARHLDTEMSPIPFADKPQEKEEGGGRKREPQTFTAVTPLSSFLWLYFSLRRSGEKTNLEELGLYRGKRR